MKRVKAQYPASNDNDWARGCPDCKFGIVSAPELTGACELYLERLIQALDKQVEFCKCKAGTRQRSYLLNRRQMLIEEARTHPLMQQYAQQLTHPDIEIARHAIMHSYEMAKVPTVRYVEPAPPAPPPTVHAAAEAVPA